MYYLFFGGAFLLGSILMMFWLKDRLQSPRLARWVHSGLIARFALAGAAFTILGALLIAAEFLG